jgi:hypothetical protein
VHDFAQGLLDALLSKIEAGGSAEKIAENDYLMKCKFVFLCPSSSFLRLTKCYSCDACYTYRTTNSHSWTCCDASAAREHPGCDGKKSEQSQL